jgi:putative transposase
MVSSVVQRPGRVCDHLPELEHPFHDRTITIMRCGRICLGPQKINISQAFAGQKLEVRQVENRIWPVSFMQFDLGFFDH